MKFGRSGKPTFPLPSSGSLTSQAIRAVSVTCSGFAVVGVKHVLPQAYRDPRATSGGQYTIPLHGLLMKK